MVGDAEIGLLVEDGKKLLILKGVYLNLCVCFVDCKTLTT